MRNALNHVLSKSKKDLGTLAIVLGVLLMVFKIAFYKETLVNTLKLFFSLVWVFVLPGFVLMLNWHENLQFFERLILGTGISAAIIGICSYYLGLLGLHTQYHGIILPFVLIGIGTIMLIRKSKETVPDQVKT